MLFISYIFIVYKFISTNALLLFSIFFCYNTLFQHVSTPICIPGDDPSRDRNMLGQSIVTLENNE
jgi:hypothetical protein